MKMLWEKAEFASFVEVRLPPGKSLANRYLILHFLAGGQIPDKLRLPEAEDVEVLRRALSCRCSISHMGMAGTASRFLLAALAFRPGEERILDAAPRLRERPLAPLVQALRELGADIHFMGKGAFPLLVKGVKPRVHEVELDAGVSSQFVSALLMVGTQFPKGLKIKLRGEEVSRSYINLTLEAIKEYGGRVEKEGAIYMVYPGLKLVDQFPQIPPDWSSVGPWFMAAALLGTEMFFPGLSLQTAQPDMRLCRLASFFGLEFQESVGGLWLKKTGEAQKMVEADMSDCPDLTPYLVLLAAALGMHFSLSGLSTLQGKESNRIEALMRLLEMMNIQSSYSDGELKGEAGEMKITQKQIFPVFNDHRMAMALAPLALIWEEIQIEEPEVVKKSYPRFWKDFGRLVLGNEKPGGPSAF